MPPKKPTAPAWLEFPGAQEIMDRAVPLVGPARESRDFGPLAEVVFETALLFANAEGRPDLRRESYAARQWMSALLDTAGVKAPPMSSPEIRAAAKKARDSILQGVRGALSPVRVRWVLSLSPEDLSRRFPGLLSSDEVFEYYKIIPKAQREVRIDRYNRRTSLQKLGALLADDEPTIVPADGPDVIHALHRLATALSPNVFNGADVETKKLLRQELAETRAALLALEDALS
ncbi:hypothetical protein [Kitasatospora purpeofusca]|uniref:Golgi phosphoprotein 3 GPP34 n=1 Tax=Kitasatospora purpeofusca TaxID=67352 RepID=A0ABZ1TZ60_9ACTN|nr:hypothetical protein [Kitasatospora purpeofusca]